MVRQVTAHTGGRHGPAATGGTPAWSAWRTVVVFGFVSLATDMVYEGARSITGPYLASLGASALVVGLVTGAGEAAALLIRLGSGPLADRSGRYWALTIVGYAMTAVCVPLMAIAPFLGASGLGVACTLILLERTGKAVRSPSKSALLAHAARAVGRGRGFGVHKALDQVGSFAGPLLVAGLVAATSVVWPALAALAIPGAVAVGLLLWIRSRVPDLSIYDADEPAPDAEPVRTAATGAGPNGTVPNGTVPNGTVPNGTGPNGTGPNGTVPTRTARTGTASGPPDRARLPGRFYVFALSASASTAGLMTFGIISFHLVDAGLVTAPVVPLVYAAAMAAAAVAALVTGYGYDRWHAKVLLALPLMVASVPGLAFSARTGVAIVGIVIWGAATGVQDSTVKALVADLVPAPRLATAYGVFAAFQGVAAVAGGALAGVLYTAHLLALIWVIVVLQVLSLALLVSLFRRDGRTER